MFQQGMLELEGGEDYEEEGGILQSIGNFFATLAHTPWFYIMLFLLFLITMIAAFSDLVALMLIGRTKDASFFAADEQFIARMVIGYGVALVIRLAVTGTGTWIFSKWPASIKMRETMNITALSAISVGFAIFAIALLVWESHGFFEAGQISGLIQEGALFAQGNFNEVFWSWFGPTLMSFGYGFSQFVLMCALPFGSVKTQRRLEGERVQAEYTKGAADEAIKWKDDVLAQAWETLGVRPLAARYAGLLMRSMLERGGTVMSPRGEAVKLSPQQVKLLQDRIRFGAPPGDRPVAFVGESSAMDPATALALALGVSQTR